MHLSAFPVCRPDVRNSSGSRIEMILFVWNFKLSWNFILLLLPRFFLFRIFTNFFFYMHPFAFSQSCIATLANSCPGNWLLSASWMPNSRPHGIPSSHSTMVSMCARRGALYKDLLESISSTHVDILRSQSIPFSSRS